MLQHRSATAEELTLYAYVVVYALYQRYAEELHEIHIDPERGRRRLPCYQRFCRDVRHFLVLDGVRFPGSVDEAHLFACFFQIRRAFDLIFRHIIGASRPAANLRAAVWQSIFTHDMRRYRRSLYRRMHDVTTLITGPSGTGKELVPRVIGLSRYIPLDPDRGTFVANVDGAFHALNLSALSPTLIESELFGHRKGAFTGALEDRAGWLESCPPLGAVLLDEIGEVDASIQVKLLRVLQTREFQRIGESEPRQFRGKLIASTNRDLGADMRAGRFREDLYYRLCSDLIVTPSLRDQLRDSPDELPNLVLFVSERVVGPHEAADLADEVLTCVDRDLGVPTMRGPATSESSSSASATCSCAGGIARPTLQELARATSSTTRCTIAASPPRSLSGGTAPLSMRKPEAIRKPLVVWTSTGGRSNAISTLTCSSG